MHWLPAVVLQAGLQPLDGWPAPLPSSGAPADDFAYLQYLIEGQALAALVQHSVLDIPALHVVDFVTVTILLLESVDFLVQEQET